MRSPLATTFGDFRRTLSLSLMVTPRKPPVLEAIDEAISEAKRMHREARAECSLEGENTANAILVKLYGARRLVAGERE